MGTKLTFGVEQILAGSSSTSRSRNAELHAATDSRHTHLTSVTDRRHADLPSVTDSRHTDLTSVTDRRHADLPSATDNRQSGLPSATDSRCAEKPSATDNRHSGLPSATDSRHVGLPSALEIRYAELHAAGSRLDRRQESINRLADIGYTSRQQAERSATTSSVAEVNGGYRQAGNTVSSSWQARSSQLVDLACSAGRRQAETAGVSRQQADSRQELANSEETSQRRQHATSSHQIR